MSREVDKFPDWYDCIEEPIRPIVRLLRDNGFNTTCSSGDKMWVECESYDDGDVTRCMNLLIEHGYSSNYLGVMLTVEKFSHRGIYWKRYMRVQIGMPDGF